MGLKLCASKKIWFPVLIVFGSIFSVTAQNVVDQIDDLVLHCHSEGMFSGSILIAKEGKILYHKSLGFANVETNLPLDNNSSFYLASIAKQITAMGIMILFEQKKLKFSDRITTYFPELPAHFDDITIRNLLTHTSGIKESYRKLKNQEGITNQMVLSATCQSDSLLFEPRTNFKYSNTGYFLLAMIIEQVSGMTYSEFQEKNIFFPLGMTNTFVYSSNQIDRANKAIGFDRFGIKSDYNKLSYGAGGIYSTTEDLFRWLGALQTDILVSKQLLEESFKPAKSKTGQLIDFPWRNNEIVGYGFGWLIHRNSLDGIFSHSGGYNGFKNVIRLDSNNDMNVIFLTNNGWACPIFELENEIQNIIDGKKYKYPKKSIGLELYQNYVKDTLIDLVNTYNSTKVESPEQFIYSELELTYLGYHFLKNNQIENAKIIFKLNTREYPDSWNTYDCYAEACFKDLKYDLALKNYKESLALNPENSNASKMIEKIRKKMAATSGKME